MKKLYKKSMLTGWLVCSLAALFYCYDYILRIEPGVMVNQLLHYYGLTASGLGLLTAMYYYAYTPLQLVVGVLTDHWGSRKILIFALLVCVLGCFFFIITKNPYVGGLGRFLVGFGSAFAFVATLRLAAMWLPASRFSLFVGLATMLGMFGAILGDIELTKLVNDFGWQHLIFYTGIAGIILVPIFLLFLHENKKDKDESSEASQDVSFTATLCHVFSNKQVVFSGIVGCMLYLSLSVIADLWGIPLVRSMGGKYVVLSSKINSMIYVGWLIGAPFFGWLSNYLKSSKKLLFAGILVSMLMICILLFANNLSVGVIIAVLFLFGFFSSSEILCFSLAKEAVGMQFVGTSVGVVNFIVMLGGAIFLPLVGFILDSTWQGGYSHGVRIYTFHSFQLAMLVVPCALVVAALCLIFFVKEADYGH